MDTFDTLRSAVCGIIEGRAYTDAEKGAICASLIKAQDRQAARRFHTGVRAHGNPDGMYPLFYIPSYNGGRKHRLITGELPKTHILSANHYELEIMRLLVRWNGKDQIVRDMADATDSRLTRPCFAHFCPKGECVGAGVAALRFHSAVGLFHPGVNRLLSPLGELFLDNRSPRSKDLPFYYFLLALSEMEDKASLELISARRSYLLELLGKEWLTGPAEGDAYNVTRKYVLRNALSRLPGYSRLKGREVVIFEGRCRLDTGDGGDEITLF